MSDGRARTVAASRCSPRSRCSSPTSACSTTSRSAPRSAGVRRPERASGALRWLDAVGVGDLASPRPTELSGGQAQRVAVARALAADPDVLLLDEPMSALDVAVAPALRQPLRDVLADRTCVVATHDVLDALLLADRVAVVEGGRVVEQGPTRDVLARPRTAFAARIAGLNLVVGTVARRSAGARRRHQRAGLARAVADPRRLGDAGRRGLPADTRSRSTATRPTAPAQRLRRRGHPGRAARRPVPGRGPSC